MKRLLGLDQPVRDLFGEPIQEYKPTGETCPACKQQTRDIKVITIGNFIASAIGNEPHADDPIASWKVAVKVHGAATLELENAEFEIARAAFNKSAYNTVVKAAGLMLLKEAEDRAVTDETLAKVTTPPE